MYSHAQHLCRLAALGFISQPNLEHRPYQLLGDYFFCIFKFVFLLIFSGVSVGSR